MKKAKKSAGFILWPLVFAAIVLAADQILVRVPLHTPGIREIQVFYRDFRQRLLTLPQTAGKPAPALPAAKVPAPALPPSAAPVNVPPPAAPQAKPRTEAPPAKKADPVNRYVYADEQGNLQFADSLDEVPAKLRREAKRLDH